MIRNDRELGKLNFNTVLSSNGIRTSRPLDNSPQTTSPLDLLSTTDRAKHIRKLSYVWSYKLYMMRTATVTSRAKHSYRVFLYRTWRRVVFSLLFSSPLLLWGRSDFSTVAEITFEAAWRPWHFQLLQCKRSWNQRKRTDARELLTNVIADSGWKQCYFWHSFWIRIFDCFIPPVTAQRQHDSRGF